MFSLGLSQKSDCDGEDVLAYRRHHRRRALTRFVLDDHALDESCEVLRMNEFLFGLIGARDSSHFSSRLRDFI